MNRLFLYFTKDGRLDPESEKLQRVQVDLCLALGYKTDDICFVSNVPFEYNGVKSIVYRPKTWPQMPKHVKGWFVATLYQEQVLKGSYWLTDHDVYQVSALSDHPRPFGVVDLAVYGVKTTGRIRHEANEVNLCCAFISEESVPFFEVLHSTMVSAKNKVLMSEERAATFMKYPGVHYLTKEYNLFAWNNIKEQLAIMKFEAIAIHFHPTHDWAVQAMCFDSIGSGRILASPLLMDILKSHGFSIAESKRAPVATPKESYGA